MSENAHAFCSEGILFLLRSLCSVYGSSQTLYHSYEVRGSESLVALHGSRSMSHALALEVSAGQRATQKPLQSHTQQVYRGVQSSEVRTGGLTTLTMFLPVVA